MKCVDSTKPYRKSGGMGHPSFCRANYGAQQNTVAILLNVGENAGQAPTFVVLGSFCSESELTCE